MAPVRYVLSATLVASFVFGGAAAHAIEWPSLRLFSSSAQPGTPEWWDDHEHKAVHEPGKGYRVPGFEGYFDGEGRPMNAPTDEVVAALRAREKRPSGLLPNLDPKLNYQRVKSAVSGRPNEEAAQQMLNEGRRLYNEKRFSSAVRTLKSAADRWPNSPVAEEALFFVAESYFYDDRYIKARDSYNKLISDYPSTRRIDTVVDRQWRIAEYWKKYHLDYNANHTLQPNLFDSTRPTFDTIGQAIKTYDSIRLNDPTGPRADDAIMETANIYFRQGRFDDADYHYTLLREDYPRSEWQFEAHLLGLQSKLRMYQGPDYDGTPLKDAEKLAKQIRTNFTGRLTAEEKDRLQTVDAQMRLEIEKRDLLLAKYYDNIQQYGAARQIYSEVARKHSGSPIAEQAAERLAQLGGLPSEPEKPIAWLVDLFPQNRQRARFAQIPEVKAAAEATRLASRPNATPTVDSQVTPAGATQFSPTTQASPTAQR